MRDRRSYRQWIYNTLLDEENINKTSRHAMYV
jgi:hypothetical protein